MGRCWIGLLIVLSAVGIAEAAERTEDIGRAAYVNTCEAALEPYCLEVFVFRDVDADVTTLRYTLLQEVESGVWAIRRQSVQGPEGEDEVLAPGLFTANGDYTIVRLNHPVIQATWRATSGLLNTQETRARVRTPEFSRRVDLNYVLRSAGVVATIDGIAFTEEGTEANATLHYLARWKNLDVTRDR